MEFQHVPKKFPKPFSGKPRENAEIPFLHSFDVGLICDIKFPEQNGSLGNNVNCFGVTIFNEHSTRISYFFCKIKKVLRVKYYPPIKLQ